MNNDWNFSWSLSLWEKPPSFIQERLPDWNILRTYPNSHWKLKLQDFKNFFAFQTKLALQLGIDSAVKIEDELCFEWNKYKEVFVEILNINPDNINLSNKYITITLPHIWEKTLQEIISKSNKNSEIYENSYRNVLIHLNNFFEERYWFLFSYIPTHYRDRIPTTYLKPFNIRIKKTQKWLIFLITDISDNILEVLKKIPKNNWFKSFLNFI